MGLFNILKTTDQRNENRGVQFRHWLVLEAKVSLADVSFVALVFETHQLKAGSQFSAWCDLFYVQSLSQIYYNSFP